jgi:hypothetical protein
LPAPDGSTETAQANRNNDPGPALRKHSAYRDLLGEIGRIPDGAGWRAHGRAAVGPGPDRSGKTDRGKAGSKYHILCNANGLPLHAMLSAANTHDSKLFEPLLERTRPCAAVAGDLAGRDAGPRSCRPT